MKLLLTLFAVSSCGDPDLQYETRDQISVYCVDGALCFSRATVELVVDELVSVVRGRKYLAGLRLHFTPERLFNKGEEVGGIYNPNEHNAWVATCPEESPFEPYGIAHEMLHAIQWKRAHRLDAEHVTKPWAHLPAIEDRIIVRLSHESKATDTAE